MAAASRNCKHPGRPARSADQLERRHRQLYSGRRQLGEICQLHEGDPVPGGEEVLHLVLTLPAQFDVDALGAEAGDVALCKQPVDGVA